MKIGFKCSACGKCCTSAPTLTISEAFEYQDDFISIMRIFSFSADPTDYAEDEARKLGIVYIRNHSITNQQALQLCPRIYAYSPNTKKCQMRDSSGKCRLHAEGRKPLTCKCVPLHPNEYTEKNLPNILNDRILRRCIRADKDCLPDDDIIWKDGAYCKKSSLVMMLEAQDSAIREDYKDLSPVVSFLLHENTSQMLFGQDYLKVLFGNPGYSISMPIPLFFEEDLLQRLNLHFNNPYLADRNRVLEFYSHQIPLLEKYIGTAEEIYRGVMSSTLMTYKKILKEAQ